MSRQDSTSNEFASDLIGLDNIRWTALDLEDYKDLYRDQIAPVLENQGKDPTTHKPTYEWMKEHGGFSFIQALGRHYDRSFGEFWEEDLDETPDENAGYPWNTDDQETIEALEDFLESRGQGYDLSESSVDALRTRLNLYVRAYREANGDDDLLSQISRDSDLPEHEAVDACLNAFGWLNDNEHRVYSARTLRRTHDIVVAWYQHLVGRRLAAFSPATTLDNVFKWKVDESPTPSLSTYHIRQLVQVADTPQSKLLVVALAGWGLRANEVASLHISQFYQPVGDGEIPYIQLGPMVGRYQDRVVLFGIEQWGFDVSQVCSIPREKYTELVSDQVPYIRFESRKNGPGEVSVLFGLEYLDEMLVEIASEDWNGYLFPSSHVGSEHITRDTVRNRFQRLASKADLPDIIQGERPSPQLCRRFWYDTYSSALEGVLEGIEEIASEQGSSDPKVVMQNYLSESRSRQLRREFMRDQLKQAFES